MGIRPWIGPCARSLGSKKRTRTFWNIFFIVSIVIVLFAMSCFVISVASDHLYYESEQMFVEYKNGILITDVGSFNVATEKNQEIKIDNLVKNVNEGDNITVTVSKIKNQVLEVKCSDKVVYKKIPTPIMPTVIASAVLVIPMLVFFVFGLVVVNIKNPGKRIAKIQKKYILRFYE